MVIGFGVVSECLSMFPNNPACWASPQGRYALGAFGIYFGGIIVLLGVIILVGRGAKSPFGKFLGSGRGAEK
jgi:hypothetical protein